jgi:hypothetical protein
MPAAMKLDYEQLKNLVRQCDSNEKNNLLHFLMEETREERIHRFFSYQEKGDVSMDEIVNELKASRQERRAQSS